MPAPIIAAGSHGGDLAANPSIYLASVLLLGLGAQWLAWRFKLPSILLLLGFGFLSGLVFDPDALIGKDLLLPVVSLAVGVILFEGGLTLSFKELKEAGVPVFRLCTWGALVTWVAAGSAAWAVAGLPWQIAALFGAILVVTGPTVIVPLLRHIKPQKKVGSIAKWEGIVIDPVGAVLAVLVLQAVLAGTLTNAAAETAIGIAKTVFFGGGLAWLAAKGLELFLRRHWIPDYLHALAFLACGAGVFVAGNLLQSECGLVAVTALGVLLANQHSVSVKHVLEFKEHLRVLLISALFIVLAARVDLADVWALGPRGLGFVAVLILVVRPLSIFISTVKSGLTTREKIFLCCLAPRGIVAAAVASIFSLEIISAVAGTELEHLTAGAKSLVPLTFSVILGTVLVYGLGAGPAARKLGLASANPQGVLFAGTPDWAIDAGELLQERGFNVLFVDTNARALQKARMRGLPTCMANILSEFVGEELDLGGLGKLFAITPNDEVNSLAVLEFRHTFGTQFGYQLAPSDNSESTSERRSTSSELRGRLLFPGEPTGSELARRKAAGGEVKATSLGEEFGWEDLENYHDGGALPMFVIRENGNLDVCTNETPRAEPGETVIYLAPIETPAEG